MKTNVTVPMTVASIFNALSIKTPAAKHGAPMKQPAATTAEPVALPKMTSADCFALAEQLYGPRPEEHGEKYDHWMDAKNAIIRECRKLGLWVTTGARYVRDDEGNAVPLSTKQRARHAAVRNAEFAARATAA